MQDTLGAAKTRGTVLGIYRGWADAGKPRQKAATAFAARVGPTMLAMRQSGMTLQKIADKLTSDRIKTAQGGKWASTTVKNVLDRLK